MEVVIMTGGKGMRMAPYTNVLPKGLLPVGDQPILEIIIKQLRYHGFTQIMMNCGYLSGLIQTYFGDGSKWGVSIDYSIEDQPLGTVGSLNNLKRLSEPFLLINCDVLTTLDFKQFRSFHLKGDSMLTLASQNRGISIDFGVLETNADVVTNFFEKPIHSAFVSMGIYMMNPEIISYIPKDQVFDIPDLIHILLKANQKVRHYENASFWLDIGRLTDYSQANEDYHRIKHLLLPGEWS